jgi:hypothetical protein
LAAADVTASNSCLAPDVVGHWAISSST